MKVTRPCLALLVGLSWIVTVGTFAADVAPKPVSGSAENLLARSITYHDPNDVWNSQRVEIAVEIKLAERLAKERGYASRMDRVEIDNSQGTFRYVSKRNEHELEVIGEGDSFSAKLNGRAEITEEERAKHGLAAERLENWRNYYGYMFGLPMKLRDPGTRIDPQLMEVEFNGHRAHRIRVTYDPEVGSDLWYFYFDPNTAALLGCRFYHDEAKEDGEFITYEGEVSGPNGLRIGKIHRWHMNLDGEWIADDIVHSIGG